MWTESGNILVREEAYYASITHTVGESSNLAILSNVLSNHILFYQQTQQIFLCFVQTKEAYLDL
jgi:hypothetical protein